MFDLTNESFLDGLTDRVAQKVTKLLLPRIESLLKVQPRYLTIESAGAYISKTEKGMEGTIKYHADDLPKIYIGGVPRIDIRDIDKLCQKQKALGC